MILWKPFQGRTNVPNANKMLKKIIFILSVGELVSAQMLSILSHTLFTRLVESNVIWDPLMRKGFWDRHVANIVSCWKELKYIAKSGVLTSEKTTLARDQWFFRRSFIRDKFGDDEIRQV